MKYLVYSFLIGLVFVFSGCCGEKCCGCKSQAAPAKVTDGWKMAVQGWTFNRFTLFEAIENVDKLGLDYIECYPGQKLSPDSDVRFTYNVSAEVKQQVKDKLAQHNVKLVNFGVFGFPKEREKCVEVFEFAKEMGIETIVSEPKTDQLAMLDELAQQYKINIAIHNHPQPSFYWNPDTVLKALEGRSKYMGACGDVGHWMRSGVNPVEAVQKLKGKIISFHFKDLNEFGNKGAHDMPWGTGVGNATAVLDEIKKQGFQGVFTAEYEYNWDNSMPELAQCVAFFKAYQNN
ncbi:MAG: sugar phosphate isomerase/epimerase [Phycisphaerae bacterium]|nr:sugar phosphate isomerase/epimerase [Phycisphaerae bacterium]